MTNTAYQGAKSRPQAAGHATAKPTSASHRSSAPSAKAAPSAKTARYAKAAARVDAKAKTAKKARVRTVTRLYTIVSDKRYSFPVAIVLVALLFTMLIMAIVTASVRVNDISSEISSLESKLNSSLSTENELRLLLETRDDLRVVENMAKNEYGMVKTDQVERYYLTTVNSDRIELVEQEVEQRSGAITDISEFFSSLIERVKNAFGR